MTKRLDTCIIYVSTLKTQNRLFHLLQAVQIAILKWDKVHTKIQKRYFNYINIFYFNLAIKLLGNTGIHKHAIRCLDNKLFAWGPNNTHSIVELEIFKTYIKTHLETWFFGLLSFLLIFPSFFKKSFIVISS